MSKLAKLAGLNPVENYDTLSVQIRLEVLNKRTNRELVYHLYSKQRVCGFESHFVHYGKLTNQMISRLGQDATSY